MSSVSDLLNGTPAQKPWCNISCNSSTSLFDTTTSLYVKTLFQSGAIQTAISATGTNQSGAFQITNNYNYVTTVTVGVNDGVKLPPPIAPLGSYGQVLYIKNLSGSALKVYPHLGGQINAGTVNANIVVQSGESVTCVAIDATNWWA